MAQNRKHCSFRNKAGFSLLEVAIAATVLSLVIASSIMALRSGFSMIEMARDTTRASQFLQSEIENLRMMNWQQINALPADAEIDLSIYTDTTTADRFQCIRLVSIIEAGLKEVILEVNWRTSNGVDRHRRYVTYFSENGMNDFYYRSF